MAKFRSLSLDELKSLDKEFIDFLVLNGITGDDWEKLKKNDPEAADGICDAFSDVVFTKILKNCRYVERYSRRLVVSIFCDNEKMHMLGVQAPDSVEIDFTKQEDIDKLKVNPPEGLQKLKSEKEYTKEREIELWDMLQDGFVISDQNLYMALFES